MKFAIMIFLLLGSSMFFVRSAIAEDPVRLWVLIVCGETDVALDSFRWDAGYMYHIFKSHILADGLIYLSTSNSDPGVNLTTTKDNFRRAINTTLMNWSRSDGTPSNDIVFIYYTGHGGGYNTIDGQLHDGRYNETDENDEGVEISNATGSYGIDECLDIGNETNREYYWDDELKTDLDCVNGTKVFVMQGCYGGGFIDDLSAQNRTIMTATNETCTSEGNNGEDGEGAGFSEWSERFIDALHGMRASANLASTPENVIHYDTKPVNADTNGDGATSLGEAWNWAWNNDEARPQDETPWLDDNGNGRPTYLNNGDRLDNDDGPRAGQIFLPLRCDLAVDELEPVEHYPIFQVFDGTMWYEGTEIDMVYTVTLKRKDSNPAKVNATVTLSRTNRDNSSDCFNITTVVQSFTLGQTVSIELVWNESQKRSMRCEMASLYTFWNISCYVEITTPGEYELDLSNNRLCNDTVEARYLPGDFNGDGIVDIFDAIIMSGHYGELDDNPNWNPDVNPSPVPDTATGKQTIDIFDAIVVSRYFDCCIFNMTGVSLSGKSGEGGTLLADATLKVEPSGVEVFRGEIFTVEVKLTDVVDLYGWEFKLYWNNTVLNCTNVTVNIPDVWENKTLEYGLGLQNSFNATHGRYWRALAPTNPAPSFDGSMTVVTLTFEASETGTSQLLLQDTKLGNSIAEPITHSATGGSVDVYYGRYMRSDTRTVNGLNAYILNATKSTNYLSYSQGASGYGVNWGIRAWVRHSNGAEQEVSLDGHTGTPKAMVTRYSGSGVQSGTVSVAQTVLQSTDSLVIRVYMKVGTSGWTTCAVFTTEQLQATQLKAETWTVYYYTWASYNRLYDYSTGKFYWGEATHNSRMQNLQYV